MAVTKLKEHKDRISRIGKVAAGVNARKGKADKKIRTTNWKSDYLSILIFIIDIVKDIKILTWSDNNTFATEWEVFSSTISIVQDCPLNKPLDGVKLKCHMIFQCPLWKML